MTSQRRRPPAAVRLLAALFPPERAAAEAAIGDLEEEYAGRADRGTLRGAAWYWAEAASLARGFAAERVRGWRRDWAPAGPVRRKGDSTMRTLWEDLRLALRGLGRRPGFAAAVVATLALGIGGNVALFSVVDSVLLRPLPYPDPDRLVIVWENDRLRGTDREPASAPDYVDLVAQSRSFETTAARIRQNRTLGTATDPVHVSSARVSSTYFPLLGVRAVLGRTFDDDDERPGAEHVLVLTEGLWRDRFAAEPKVVGRSVLLDGTPATVVGVVPNRATVPGLNEEMFEPLVFGGDELERDIHKLRVFARLAPGATVATAQADASAVMARLEKTYPDENEGRGAWVRPLVEEVVGGARPGLRLLFGAVALLLLMACASAANLVLARGISRERELAVRTSLGAGPLRVFRLLLTESLLLAMLGGALGTLLAAGTVWLVRAIGPEDLARLQECAVDGRSLLFALLGPPEPHRSGLRVPQGLARPGMAGLYRLRRRAAGAARGAAGRRGCRLRPPGSRGPGLDDRRDGGRTPAADSGPAGRGVLPSGQSRVLPDAGRSTPAREGVRPLRRARGAAGRGGERGLRGPALPRARTPSAATSWWPACPARSWDSRATSGSRASRRVPPRPCTFPSTRTHSRR